MAVNERYRSSLKHILHAREKWEACRPQKQQWPDENRDGGGVYSIFISVDFNAGLLSNEYYNPLTRHGAAAHSHSNGLVELLPRKASRLYVLDERGRAEFNLKLETGVMKHIRVIQSAVRVYLVRKNRRRFAQ